jgi:hypothetical protein
MLSGLTILFYNQKASTEVPLEKLRVVQLVKKYRTLCGIQRFLTAFTRTNLWSLI